MSVSELHLDKGDLVVVAVVVKAVSPYLRVVQRGAVVAALAPKYSSS